MKARGSTPELSSILSDLSTVEAGGMGGVAVKCIDTVQNPDCEGSWLTVTDAEARKRGERTGLDTLVVHAVNDGYSPWAIDSPRLSESGKYPTWGVRRQR